MSYCCKTGERKLRHSDREIIKAFSNRFVVIEENELQLEIQEESLEVAQIESHPEILDVTIELTTAESCNLRSECSSSNIITQQMNRLLTLVSVPPHLPLYS